VHDLNTINRLNREAHEGSIISARKQGKHVIARYEGSRLIETINFDSEAAANAHLDAHDTADARKGGTKHQLFAPTN
jgi:hypothetical protein